jgi:rsbT co-antagonist protein RsbR
MAMARATSSLRGERSSWAEWTSPLLHGKLTGHLGPYFSVRQEGGGPSQALVATRSSQALGQHVVERSEYSSHQATWRPPVADGSNTTRAADAHIAHVLEQDQDALLQDWVAAAQSRPHSGRGAISTGDLRAQCREILSLLPRAIASGDGDINAPAWGGVRESLGSLSRSRAQQGFSPSDTATFVLSLKEPLFKRLRTAAGSDVDALADHVSATTRMLDSLGLYTTEVFLRSREALIERQQQDMLELSTPVVSIWDGILALPMIGTLDSARTQVVMEALLQRIVESGASIAIVDITGVPTVDTLTAQHLLKTVTAARLMGAECIISGIRPAIAQTIVHLGVDLGGVTTKASLADALRLAFQKTGRSVVRSAPSAANGGSRSYGAPSSAGE